MANVLPDSRLAVPKGTVMVDWRLPSGGTERIEAEPIFCANCGKSGGFVPKENTAFAFWLCQPCADKFGAIAGTYQESDAEFNRKVQEEMGARFGKSLTVEEIAGAVDSGTLGTALEKLMNESPYPSADHRSRR